MDARSALQFFTASRALRNMLSLETVDRLQTLARYEAFWDREVQAVKDHEEEYNKELEEIAGQIDSTKT